MQESKARHQPQNLQRADEEFNGKISVELLVRAADPCQSPRRLRLGIVVTIIMHSYSCFVRTFSTLKVAETVM
jgi:hypothetical protein